MKARIRELIRAVPFHPFVMRMSDGRTFRVEDPAFIMASPKAHSDVMVEESAERMHSLPVSSIISVETP